MKSFSCIITSENGIHARPAGMLVKEAVKFKSKISVFKDGKSADAKGLFSLMGLEIKNGDEILVEVEGDDEQDAAQKISEFLHEKFCSGGYVEYDGIKR